MRIDLDNNIEELKLMQRDADSCIIGKMSPETLCTKVEDHLGRISNGKVRYKISIVEVKSKHPFIMCVYPDENELESRAQGLVHSINTGKLDEFTALWNDIPKWTIEIDSRLFQKNSGIALDNGGQFVAILCHELGHINNTHPMKLFLNYQKNKAQYSVFEKVILTKPIMTLLFLPMFVCAAGLRIVISKPSHDINEIAADMRVPDEFKPYLMEYTENHIINRPESGIIVTEQEFDNEQDTGIRFTRSCIELMKKRRNVLKLHLSTQYKVSESPYFKNICKIASKAITGELTDNMRRALTRDKYLTESFERDYNEALRESYSVLESMSVTDRDIVMLTIEAENISTPEDKQYIISTIYDFYDALMHQKEKVAKKFKNVDNIPASATIDMKIKRLNEIEKKVMATPVSRNGDYYGVFIKYPAGYEG